MIKWLLKSIMGIWSRALFTNFPEGRIDMSKFPENHRIRRHVGDETNVISLKEFMELFSENDKLWGYMTRDTMVAFEELFREIVAQNPVHPDVIELHFYCLDDSMPYYLGYNTKHERAFYRLYYSHDVAFFTLGSPVDGFYRPDFKEDLYQKRYTKVFASTTVQFEDAIQERGMLF
jgi:hypothetical protein